MSLPARIGKYPVQGVIGQGAMGVVYRAFDPDIHRAVAIKTIQKSLIGDADEGAAAAARFRNEAQAVGRLAHPGIVAIYEFGEDDAQAYIAMEFVDGLNLEKILRGRGALPEAEALSVMDPLLDALDCAHAHGVWHRDVKPANVLLTREGRVKLTDFGIARIESIALTRVASMIGTPGYMAPEQYTGQGLSHRVDLFAAGVLLYRLLTGVAPFVGDAQTVMYKILHEEPAPPSQAGAAAVPPLYDAIVARALAKDPAQRFASAREFRHALSARGLAPGAAGPGGADTDATIVAPSPRPPGPAVRAGTGAPPAAPGTGGFAGPGSLGSAGGGATWMPTVNAQVIEDMERELATFMGPIARAIVRQAARTSADADSLRQAVAQHIPDARERAQFVAGPAAAPAPVTRTLFSGRGTRPPAAPRTGASGAAAGTAGPAGTAGTAGTAGAAGRQPVTDAVMAAALPVLTEIVGPIARVMIRQAASRSATCAEFVQRLADGVEPADRARVLAALAPFGGGG